MFIKSANKIYEVANKPEVRKWARSLMKKKDATMVKKPTSSQMKKATPLTKSAMSKISGSKDIRKLIPDRLGKKKKGIDAFKKEPLVKQRLVIAPSKTDKVIEAGGAGAGGYAAAKFMTSAEKKHKSTKAKLEAAKKKKYVKSPKSVRKNRGGTVRKSYNY